MFRAIVCSALAAWCLALGSQALANHGDGASIGRTVPADDLFYNYYVGRPGYGVPAQLYPSPRPTPPRVGHTYITYQPLMPHEFMYTHRRTYYSAHPSGGLNRTKVSYRWSPFGQINPILPPVKPRPVGVNWDRGRWWAE